MRNGVSFLGNQIDNTNRSNRSMNPRVLLITRHNVPNYGSVMQAYATENVLRALSCSPITLDYRRSNETLEGQIRRHSEGRSLVHRFYRRAIWPVLRRRSERTFRAMREQMLTLSEPCDETNIWDSLPETDVFLTGSDQVWNALGDGMIDGAFFWEGVERLPGQRIVSYAASFGRDVVTSGYERKVGELLARYDAISVREDSGVSIVESYGYAAKQVLDPTLLLSGDKWAEMSSDAKVPSKSYALVYNLHPDSDTLDYVSRKAASSGLEIVSVCPTYRRRIGRHIILPTLPEFLGLFLNAACVYTDSFHGTALCVNLGIPFVAVFPKENAARNKSLLCLLGLENRAWDVFEGNAWDDDIDWSHVRSVLALERKRSMAWFASALGVGQNVENLRG